MHAAESGPSGLRSKFPVCRRVSPATMSVEIGATIKATVIRLAEYGAIVRMDGGRTGLVHISEIADTYVRDVREYLAESDVVNVKVLRLSSKGRYDLSIRQAGGSVIAPDSRSPCVKELNATDSSITQRPSTQSFEDRLTKFLKESAERQHDLKRHLDIRRGRK